MTSCNLVFINIKIVKYISLGLHM